MAANMDGASSSPLAPPDIYLRSDDGFATAQQLRQKKRKKCIAYIAVFALLQIIVILVFALVILRFKTPKFRLRAASFTTFEIGNNATNPSFNFLVNAQFTVKNTNFGKYEYDYGTVGFEYRGVSVGLVNIDDARVKARTTKKVNASVSLSSNGLGSGLSDELGSDIGGGVLGLRSRSTLEGEIKILKVFKKKKYARMDCTLDVEISTQTIKNVICI
ncbi:late embryogenesis abundant protein At1g64065 [Ziziphus jujuba]|uniref:Late embryogenesis abundant protein At1g64065 n=1 Tax=Ziziphus jujuba TaxID=326968 RepID=A0A6P3ZS66_ZIZJJ|nr:late embryogenesis abundant protein At1g64065 [Ziziphus jujuba]